MEQCAGKMRVQQEGARTTLKSAGFCGHSDKNAGFASTVGLQTCRKSAQAH